MNEYEKNSLNNNFNSPLQQTQSGTNGADVFENVQESQFSAVQEQRVEMPNIGLNQTQQPQGNGRSSIPPVQPQPLAYIANGTAQPMAYYIPQETPKKKSGAGKIVLIIVAIFMALVVFGSMALGMLFVGMMSVSGGGFSMLSGPPISSFSVIDIQGSISYDSFTYDHAATLDYIDALSETENDKGILLFMNTPGGGVYEGTELYEALLEYKEKTGRPVWAYMGPVCTSAGYQITMASDYIVANTHTTTGSIGVYVALQDVSGLYDLLGIQMHLIRSGDNKGVGVAGVPITEEQQAVYQGIVDESFDMFVNTVEQGRGMSREQVLSLADGRIFTGTQALNNGMIDGLGEWDTLLEEFEAHTGAAPYYPNVSQPSYVTQMIGSLQEIIPQSDTQAILGAMEGFPSGVPMAYAADLADRAVYTQLVD